MSLGAILAAFNALLNKSKITVQGYINHCYRLLTDLKCNNCELTLTTNKQKESHRF